MIGKKEIQERFSLFHTNTGGISTWLTDGTPDIVFSRLGSIEERPLKLQGLNQLLALSHEGTVTPGFFHFYWLTAPADHPYDVRKLPDFNPEWVGGDSIVSLDHLRWGLYRLYIDALLFFGNVRSAYRRLRTMDAVALGALFAAKRHDTIALAKRDDGLPLVPIAKDDRYLISEMACKSYGEGDVDASDLRDALVNAWETFAAKGGKRAKVHELLSEEYVVKKAHQNRQTEFLFSAADILSEEVTSREELVGRVTRIAEAYKRARDAALHNTALYLSSVNELDVYVATSMRTRDQFRKMAEFCEFVFSHEAVRDLKLRYFDPTLSAAQGHEDKGLIECLMVKCAKVLVYCSGDRESYGKDAEAAMALSLGKPVIFFCDEAERGRFYREVHPLSRLIEIATGVAVGCMVTHERERVAHLLSAILRNDLTYALSQHPARKGFLRLQEGTTGSVIRLQTDDKMLAETFWNHYHGGTAGAGQRS